MRLQQQRRSAMHAAKEVALPSLFCRSYRVALKLLVAAGVSHPHPATIRGQARPVKNGGEECNTMQMDIAARTRIVLFRTKPKSITISLRGAKADGDLG